MNPLLSKLFANPHTTGAGLAFVALKAGSKIALLWFPQHSEKIIGTADVLEGVAGFYGLAMAGDAGKGEKALQDAKQDVATAIQTQNTDILTK